MDKIKVLTINWTNNDGSTVKLINDIEEKTKDTCDYYHCYQVGGKSNGKNYLVAGWNITRMYYRWARVVGLKYGVGIIPTRRLLKYIDGVKPDVIHIHCPNFYNINLYLLFEHLKNKKYPVVITNHAEFFYTGNCAYAFECTGYLSGCRNCNRVFDKKNPFIVNRTDTEWQKMKKAFADADKFKMTVVSQWQYDRIKQSPIAGHLPIYLIENGVNTEIFMRKSVNTELRDRLADRRKRIVLNVTSNFSDSIEDVKGGYYFIQLAKRMPEYVFVVAGNDNVKDKSKLSENLILLDNVLDQNELADYYNMADLTVLTSRRETFGMACAESMACGTPVVGYMAGGTESIAIPEYSEFVEYGNMDGLINLINDWIDKKGAFVDELELEAKKRYSVERMAKQFQELYVETISAGE